MFVDCRRTGAANYNLYELLLSCVLPRPIAWVSTRSLSGVDNLAPFSFFNLFSVKPAILGFSPGLKRKPEGGKGEVVLKDTLRNVIDKKEFVVNIVSMDLVEKMVQTSAEYDEHTSEFAACGLTAETSNMLDCPRLAEAKISMECRLFEIVDLGSSKLVLGEIVCLHIDDEILSSGQVDVLKLAPVGRLGADLYCRVSEPFALKRPVL